MRWDPRVYSHYADERGRAFFELLARVPTTAPTAVVDLGCGPGSLTATLLERWPKARVVGVDSSAEMIATAQEHAVAGRLSFVQADVSEWQPEDAVDVVVANAVLHWVPRHVELVAEFARWLSPGGTVAFQVPDNFSEPSHTLLHEVRTSPKWRTTLGGDDGAGPRVERPERYLQALVQAGLEPDVWQTTYLHVLPGDDAVLEWVKGTALRPVLALLTDEERDDFLADYGARLRAVYPRQTWGTVFPFRRTFAVGHRRQRD